MNRDSINLAIGKKYTDFSNEIKDELKNKLSNHEYCINYANEIDNIKQMKDTFAGINLNIHDEPSAEQNAEI